MPLSISFFLPSPPLPNTQNTTQVEKAARFIPEIIEIQLQFMENIKRNLYYNTWICSQVTLNQILKVRLQSNYQKKPIEWYRYTRANIGMAF